MVVIFCFFKQKPAYEMRISDWSSDVCSSDLGTISTDPGVLLGTPKPHRKLPGVLRREEATRLLELAAVASDDDSPVGCRDRAILELLYATGVRRSEERRVGKECGSTGRSRW